VDAREVDVDQVLQHRFSASTSHLFGKTGSLPPEDAVVERRYTKWWSTVGEHGQDYVGLNKANSSTKGRFLIPDLVEGEYKLVIKLSKSNNILGYATVPIGVILGGVNMLAAPADKKEETYARGMPTEYVEVTVTVKTDSYVILETKAELDQGADLMTRVFTIKESDVNASVQIVCNSFSLLKRMRIQADLFRCDLPTKKPAVWNMRAEQGRNLVKQALSSSSQLETKPVPVPPVQQARATTPRKKKRTVLLDSSVNVEEVLFDFYSQHAPEKVEEIPKIVDFFIQRDKHLGVLFATLEDKYGVTFQKNGQWD
jgi:hypothetical protein